MTRQSVEAIGGAVQAVGMTAALPTSKLTAAIGAVLIFAVSAVAVAENPKPAVNQNSPITQNVNVVNTPTVNVGTLPAVSISGTPTVAVSGTPTVNVAALPAVTLSGTPTVNVGNTAANPVPISGTVAPGIPGTPLFVSLVPGGPSVTGPGTGTWAITSITLTNSGASAATVRIFEPVLISNGLPCGGSINGGSEPSFTVIVPAQQTLHLPYPASLVVTPVSGQSCMTATGASNVEIDFNGYVQQ